MFGENKNYNWTLTQMSFILLKSTLTKMMGSTFYEEK